MKYKYIITNCTNPYDNLAFEQSLLGIPDEETVIIYLWQNENTIVIGRNQDVYAECRVDEFLSAAGKIARRHSGGGAVYHDLGNLNYSIISCASLEEKCAYQDLMVKALSTMGLYVDFNGRNDLLIDGRKFSGNAFFTNGSVVCQHGTILVNSDIEKMAYYLTPEISKLSRNHVKSVNSRVINLSELLPDLTIFSLHKALIDVTKAEPLDSLPDEEEVRRLSALYAGDNWIYRRKFE